MEDLVSDKTTRKELLAFMKRQQKIDKEVREAFFQEQEEQNKKDLANFREELYSKLDDYLNYFVKDYLEDNKAEIHSAVTMNTAKRVLEFFQSMVEDFNMKLEEPKKKITPKVKLKKIKTKITRDIFAI